jgi:hypothetical protein
MFSFDIARPVSPGGGEGANSELLARKTAWWLRVKKTLPRRDAMDDKEMIRILEEIIRDPDTNPTARCTAIPDAEGDPS